MRPILLIKLNTKGCFTIISFYSKLLHLNYSSAGTLVERGFPSQLIWSSLALGKVSFFVWEASHGKILTGDNLQKKGINIVIRHFMCKGDAESGDHLLLHCKAARVLWDLAISCLGVSWVAFDSIKNHLLAWEGFFGARKKSKAGRILPHVIFWCIWRERNRRAFEGVKIPLQCLKDILIKTPYFWESGLAEILRVGLSA